LAAEKFGNRHDDRGILQALSPLTCLYVKC
jgi:hypothetical protein